MACGWGWSLATYGMVAGGWGGPLGACDGKRPILPVLVGAACMLLAGAYAFARGYGGYVLSASLIPAFGAAWAAFWTGFLRVGAQSALLLAPLVALLLIAWWSG